MEMYTTVIGILRQIERNRIDTQKAIYYEGLPLMFVEAEFYNLSSANWEPRKAGVFLV